MAFDGTDDYIDCGTISSFDDGDISFALWCNLTSNGTFQYILSSTNSSSVAGINIAVNNSGLLYFERSQAAANTQNFTSFYVVTGFTFGNWHHICGTYNATSGELKAYVDGDLKSTTTDVADTRSTSTALKIGGLSASSSLPANGNISNVAIFSSTLTQDQILTIYNGGVPNSISSLSPVSWWSLAGDSYYDGTNWICPDLGSGGNNGTSSGMGGSELVGDGPGSTANGVATSMDIPANLKGNAPNSSSNAFSVNMNSQDRVADVPA
jgi:hypothetical protein